MLPPPDKIAALRIERKPLAELKPHPRNPRTHAEPGTPKWLALEKSLGLDYFDPLVWNQRNGLLVSGHFRLKVLTHLGFSAADVSVVDYDEPTHIARLIAANQFLGEWEEELLSRLAAELTSGGVDAALAGLTEKDLAKFAKSPAVTDDTPAAAEMLTAAEKLQAQWQVKPGDLFTIGAHRLLCGDCREPANWLRLLGTEKPALIWTDPPYNVAYEGAAGSMRNDDLSAAAYDRFLRAAFGALLAIAKPGAAIYVAHADSEGLAVRRAFEGTGWFFSQCLIWVKNAFTLSRQDHQWQHEPILYGWKPGAGHYWQGGFSHATVIDDERDLGTLDKAELLALARELRAAIQTTVVREARNTVNELHPTVKPLPLVAAQIWRSSHTGDLVVDGFGGSGTTLIAAEQTHRRGAIMEDDPKYCAVILERATAQGLAINRL
ncbi:MAG: DNA modification methylase [Chthoniobacteraceae bacterium]